MGQKSNPNSFQLSNKTAITSGSNHNTIEYSTLLKEHLNVSSNLISFFEKNSCLVKDCFFVINNEKSFVTLFINFFVLKRSKSLKHSGNLSVVDSDVSLFVQKFFNILSKFGYFSSKRLVLQNLNKIAFKYQKTFFSGEHLFLKKELSMFSKEIYFESGLFLFCLMNTTKNTSSLIAKFIARFFKIFHRTKKINKFLLFLLKFIENVNNLRFQNNKIKGLKIQIKGRFKGAPRSKVRTFSKGRIPLQTISSHINYSLTHINTSYGIFGVKVWVFE
jgi:hypothetical protein